MRRRVGSWAWLLLLAPAATAVERPKSFLILDLGGDGLYLAGPSYPVRFDLDGDGNEEQTAWTAAGRDEAFLWIDADADGLVDDGTELLASAVDEAGGTTPAHRRLSAYDGIARGGDGDGRLTPADEIWARLQLWVDRDHDGRSTPRELSKLSDWGITAIDLGFRDYLLLDGSANLVRAESDFETAHVPAAGRVLEIEFAEPGGR